LQKYLTGDIRRTAVELPEHAFCQFQALPLIENVVHFQQQFQLSPVYVRLGTQRKNDLVQSRIYDRLVPFHTQNWV